MPGEGSSHALDATSAGDVEAFHNILECGEVRLEVVVFWGLVHKPVEPAAFKPPVDEVFLPQSALVLGNREHPKPWRVGHRSRCALKHLEALLPRIGRELVGEDFGQLQR